MTETIIKIIVIVIAILLGLALIARNDTPQGPPPSNLE